MNVQSSTRSSAPLLAGARTLLYKEVLRFWKVSFQTVAAPVLTAVLYLLIFGHVLEDHVKVYNSVGYTSFLIPGLVMMSVLQNAFANSSSSLIQSKITGNLVFLLVTPLSHWAWFVAYVGASVVRGLVVGLGVLLVTVWFAPPGLAQPLWALVFALLGAPTWAEAVRAGGMFGTKIVLNEFVAFIDLGHATGLSQKTIAIVTFALCGFANFSSIAIQMAVTGSLAPNQRPLIAKLGIKALVAGALSNLMSAALAGLFLAL